MACPTQSSHLIADVAPRTPQLSSVPRCWGSPLDHRLVQICSPVWTCFWPISCSDPGQSSPCSWFLQCCFRTRLQLLPPQSPPAAPLNWSMFLAMQVPSQCTAEASTTLDSSAVSLTTVTLASISTQRECRSIYCGRCDRRANIKIGIRNLHLPQPGCWGRWISWHMTVIETSKPWGFIYYLWWVFVVVVFFVNLTQT